MKFAIIAPALAVAAILMAANIQPMQSGSLTVHEWGTFTSVAGESGSAIDWDVLGCKSDLPKFVGDSGLRNRKEVLTGKVRMETPVMYFYSSHELDAHVKVSFPNGNITEWYPRANLLGSDIEWPSVRIEPNTSPDFPIESDQNRYYSARETDAAPLTVGDQHEKFLFYRGVGQFQAPLSATISDDGEVTVTNSGKEAVSDVILFDNHGGHVGYRNAGALETGVTLDSPSPDASLPVLRQELVSALVAQGLFPKEARAMVETWRDSWFEEGSRLIYILPPSAVDEVLPLQIDPAPSSTTRVFVGRIELVTPATKNVIKAAVAQGDWSAMASYGRFLEPILNRIYNGNAALANQIERRANACAGR